ncbi:MAG TPA: hypothetical protein VFD55_01020, partial [Candidatus Angelobacter sp.]|nr:hypothetical protein [Candidatus Angelobacter sp.]
IKALNLLERVLNDKGLGLEESAKVEARNVFLLSKLDGYLNRYALKEALLCASNENKKAYGKALKILERINNSDQAFMLELFTNTKVKKIPKPKAKARTISASPKHVVKKNDKPKEAKKIDKPKPEIKKSKNLASETPNRENKLRVGIQILIIALLISLLIVVIVVSCKPQTAAVVVNETTTTETTAIATSTTTAALTNTWKMIQGDHGNNRWFTDGIIEIRDAKTDKDALNAAYVWVDKAKYDPNLLVAVTKYFLARDVDKTALVDENGWATDKAVQLVAELELVLGQAKVTVEKAPKKGFNTGVEDGEVVRAQKAVITGDRTGIRIDITLLDGKVVSFWIMARCGNVVTKEEPKLPVGKTDNPETPTTTTTAPPTTTTAPPTTTTLEEKSDDPNDYQSPGNDSTNDSGTGDKPTVTTVTTPPESTPPEVITEEVVNGVTETPTNDPGSETGIISPGAETPTETTTAPATEPDVNPGTDNSGTNTGDSGNPFQ